MVTFTGKIAVLLVVIINTIARNKMDNMTECSEVSLSNQNHRGNW